MEHHTGYIVFAYGLRWWHRSLERALARAERAEKWAAGFVQVIEAATGRLVYGRPQ